MAICSGDCQDQGCKMIAECERVYKASSPPCAELVEEKFTSTNTASLAIAAQKVVDDWGSDAEGKVGVTNIRLLRAALQQQA